MSAKQPATSIGPTSILSILSKKAKLMVKEGGIKHTEALDALAQSIDQPNWKHLLDCVERYRPAEEAMKFGLVFCIDGKEGDDVDTRDGKFIHDPILRVIVEDDKRLIKAFQKLWKSYGEAYSLRDPEVRESLEEMLGSTYFFRLAPGVPLPASIEDASDMIEEISYWRPDGIWLKGNFTSLL